MINEENLMLWVTVGAGAILILLIIYLYIKENESTKRTKRYEKTIKELNKEVYRQKKKIKNTEMNVEQFKSNIKQQIYQDMRLEMKNLIDSNLHSSVMPLRSQIDLLQNQLENSKDMLENKIFGLEDRIKEFAYTPTNPTNIDEGRIISMFKDGWSVDSIAKELRIGKGEVEFTLKFANLN